MDGLRKGVLSSVEVRVRPGLVRWLQAEEPEKQQTEEALRKRVLIRRYQGSSPDEENIKGEDEEGLELHRPGVVETDSLLPPTTSPLDLSPSVLSGFSLQRPFNLTKQRNLLTRTNQKVKSHIFTV